MNIIYKVDPSNINDMNSLSNKKKRNIFNGSNGRIIVDEVDGEDGAFN